MTKYTFPTAFSNWGDEEAAAIDRVRASGNWTMGEEVAAFEAEFSAFHGKKHGIMTNSGSSANLLAVASLFHKTDNPLKRGDKVLVPAVAWSTTYAPLVQYGLDIVLADIDETWNAAPSYPDADARLVVGCSILGNPAHLHWWKTQAERHGAYFIEDNCESLGALTRTKPGRFDTLCGTFGLLSTCSFFYSHQLSAIEGGMILTDDDELADLCRMLRAHGWTRDTARPGQSDHRFEAEYDFRLFGYNLRGLELHAAVAREQLKKLEQFRRQRQQNWHNFFTWTMDLPITQPKVNGILSPFSIHFSVKDKETRSQLVTALRANGIDCRLPTGGSFLRHPYGAAYGPPWRDQKTPEADKLHDTGLFIGNPPFAFEEEILRAVKVMEGAFWRAQNA